MSCSWLQKKDILCCNNCGNADLMYQEEHQNLLHCSCGKTYHSVDGILNFQGDSTISSNISRSLMNFKPLVAIYNSMWRFLTYPVLTAIPYPKEMETILGFHDLEQITMFLDIACGPGTYSMAFAEKLGPHSCVVGVDYAWNMLRRASMESKRRGLNTILLGRSAAETLPFAAESFDGINCTGALHLFDDMESVINKIAEMLKPGGIFSCMTFCHTGRPRIDSFIQKRGIHLFEPKALEETWQNAGLETVENIQSRWMLLTAARKG